jgi:hypothetical protein
MLSSLKTPAFVSCRFKVASLSKPKTINQCISVDLTLSQLFESFFHTIKSLLCGTAESDVPWEWMPGLLRYTLLPLLVMSASCKLRRAGSSSPNCLSVHGELMQQQPRSCIYHQSCHNRPVRSIRTREPRTKDWGGLCVLTVFASSD